ncbi:MAG: hypothetical protein HC849_29295 [Oscillatoriales cyanobacterium RU_3_3]|nr:hypothetical protein [Oscillatoriales cyanobacterium RU_3_3]
MIVEGEVFGTGLNPEAQIPKKPGFSSVFKASMQYFLKKPGFWLTVNCQLSFASD